MQKEVFITHTNCITPLGFDIASNMDAISKGLSGIQLHENPRIMSQPFYSAIINQEALDIAFAKISKDPDFTKLEKMLLLALTPKLAKKKNKSKTAFLL